MYGLFRSSTDRHHMKQYLLAFCAVLIGATAGAQRLGLIEEFTGEQCGPCKEHNGALWALATASGNASKVLLIKYQTNIPTAGVIYNTHPAVSHDRRSYYSCSQAPQLYFDGFLSSPSSASPGYPPFLTQAEINSHAAAATPFRMTVTHTWNSAKDSITANVTITATAAYSASSNLKLRVALIESLQFCSDPNSLIDTQKHFPNIVREMYPNAAGTVIPTTWTASQSRSFAIRGKAPDFFNKLNPDAFLAVWIQDDATRSVKQAARTGSIRLPMFDAGIEDCPHDQLMCTGNGSKISIRNTGTTGTLTSAKIYSRIDNGPYGTTPLSWTGSIPPGGSAVVTIPPQAATTGKHYRFDSLALPNGAPDKNLGNNVRQARVDIASTAPVSLPYYQDCAVGYFVELPSDWMYHDFKGNERIWHHRRIDGPNGRINSFASFDTKSGKDAYLIIPTPAAAPSRVLDFFQTYAQTSPSNTDNLEVVYSTDCGTSWTTLWSASGAGLVTMTSNWPSGGADTSADWKLRRVNLNPVPANALLAFHGIAGGGVSLFIDNVRMHASSLGVAPTSGAEDLRIYPNPATSMATLEFTLGAPTQATISLADLTGRTLKIISDGALREGAQRFTIPTDGLASGIYLVTVRTEEGTVVRKLTVGR